MKTVFSWNKKLPTIGIGFSVVTGLLISMGLKIRQRLSIVEGAMEDADSKVPHASIKY